jgi:hypothetical protein
MEALRFHPTPAGSWFSKEIHMNSNTKQQKFEAEIAKLIAETMKIQAEAKWYPFVVLAGVVAATAGIIKLFA